jgi:pimeloyl-ACP methyl ester carboxylesterase
MFSRFLMVVVTLVIVLGAGWLALRRPDIALDRLESAYTNSDSRFLTLNETTRLHLRDVGPREAPAIILVHGFSSSLHTWEAWADILKVNYRVISIDLPGHGLTGCVDNAEIGQPQFVAAVDAVARALALERFTLIGNSMGGQTAWSYALAHPEKLDALVLVDAAGWPAAAGDDKNSPLVFKLLGNKFARDIMRDLDMSGLVRSGLEDSFVDPALVTDAMVERYASLARAPCHRDAIIALSTGRSARQAASDEVLAPISTPTLVMHGAADNLIPVANAQKFASAIPGAELKIYANAGHLPHEELPAESAADLTAFLTRALAAAPETAAVPTPTP